MPADPNDRRGHSGPGPSCWEYGRRTGAEAGINARYSTETWFHAHNGVWVFPTAGRPT